VRHSLYILDFAGFPKDRDSIKGIKCLFILLFTLCCADTNRAIPLRDYHRHLEQAISALATLSQSEESETTANRALRMTDTLQGVRIVMPETANVEWGQISFAVDNRWLHKELEKYEKARSSDQTEILAAITERLQAIEEQVAKIGQAGPAISQDKEIASSKLKEILQRPEYAKSVYESSALARLLRKFLQWIESLFPKPDPLALGGGSTLFTKVAQVFVILLAFGVLAYVFKMLAPRLLRKRRSRKKGKVQPRIILGETLDPDQSATDLLAEAEALARSGELRAAIRKAYIALLLELGERKIISLAQYKTNRDYLGALREIEPLYGNVKQLTERFERHWYGFVSANEEDWLAFRTGYKQALQS